MLEDLLFGGAASTALGEPGTSPAEVAPLLLTRCNEAFALGLRSVGADPQFGVRLPAALLDAGLQDVQAEFTSRLLRGGSPGSDFYTYSLRERGAQLVAAGLLTEDEVAACTAAVGDPASFWFSIGLVSAWGRRPSRPPPEGVEAVLPAGHRAGVSRTATVSRSGSTSAVLPVPPVIGGSSSARSRPTLELAGFHDGGLRKSPSASSPSSRR